MKKQIFLGVITVGIAAAAMSTASFVQAHGGATGVVKERMELMKALGDTMKTMKAMFQNKTPHDAGEIRKAAKTIRSLSGEKITKLFPEGSLDKPSEALPSIWKNWGHFKSLSADLAVFAGTLDAAADNKMEPAHMKGGPMMKGRGNMMMGRGNMMQGGPMMGGNGPDPEALKSMPAMASFMKISQTCSTCHTDYRLKKDK